MIAISPLHSQFFFTGQATCTELIYAAARKNINKYKNHGQKAFSPAWGWLLVSSSLQVQIPSISNRICARVFVVVKYMNETLWYNDDVIQWKHFPRYWPFVRGIHRSPVNSQHKGQWRGALMFALICAWIKGWVNNREAGDLIAITPIMTSL